MILIVFYVLIHCQKETVLIYIFKLSRNLVIFFFWISLVILKKKNLWKWMYYCVNKTGWNFISHLRSSEPSLETNIVEIIMEIMYLRGNICNGTCLILNHFSKRQIYIIFNIINKIWFHRYCDCLWTFKTNKILWK